MSNLENYCLISTLPVISKVIEKAVHRQLTSVSEQLVVVIFTDDVQVDNDRLVGTVFVNLSKAFDIVSHATLLHKLTSYDITYLELQWFTDHLINRKQ